MIVFDSDRLAGINQIIAAIKSACPGIKTITLDIADVKWLISQADQVEELISDFEAMEKTAHKWMERSQLADSKNYELHEEITKLKSMRRIGRYLKVEAENLQLSKEIKCLKFKSEMGCCCNEKSSCKNHSH
ncbi:MAG: hypothetical protein K0S80_3930 [Neobacillus sp.]|nr:hypothetical protein [Neobacillus sp.]